ncbi:nitroreductase family protein [Methyloversatilis thermotolerans]|uniref:nitroreductase family protein n=1 Tax=Methyloversatilis thermotolerans TaxID=1346290 RepID=UPI0003757F75|nr:nitroreductase family protein [Methyloversatilis thermotolerans]
MRAIEAILDAARWAPSGDNTQTWQFDILADDRVRIHGFDTRDWCVYDLDGHASQLALGALLETLRIAASAHGLRAEWTRRAATADNHLMIDVVLTPDPGLGADERRPYIESRSVQRRAMGSAALSAAEKAELEAAAVPCRVIWFEALPARASIARLNFDSAEIRLTIPEAYRTHSTIIEWGARFSEDRIPEVAVGVDPATARLMRFVLASWRRVEFFNRWLMGTLVPRLQLDLIPGLACSGHAYLVMPSPPVTVDDYVAAGQCMQRFWLTVEKLGMQSQPEMTPLIFARYVRENRPFTDLPAGRQGAAGIADRLAALLGPEALARATWACRIGRRRALPGRSLRKPLSALLR